VPHRGRGEDARRRIFVLSKHEQRVLEVGACGGRCVLHLYLAERARERTAHLDGGRCELAHTDLEVRVGQVAARRERDEGGSADLWQRIVDQLAQERSVVLDSGARAERRRAHLGIAVVEQSIGDGHEVGASTLDEQLEGAQDHRLRRVEEDEGGNQPAA
jgi:hypothetical protein